MPLVTLDAIELADANRLLAAWGHRHGPIKRVAYRPFACHALLHQGEPVAVAVAASLIRPNVAKHPELHRGNTIELARLCASRPHLCRPMLRLWREFVLPTQREEFVVSYQDRSLHSGDVYRFDGWRMIGTSDSGPDQRTGRKGVMKRMWAWPADRFDANGRLVPVAAGALIGA